MKHLKKFDDMESMDFVPDPGFPNAFWGVHPPLANKFKLKTKKEPKNPIISPGFFNRLLDSVIAFFYVSI